MHGLLGLATGSGFSPAPHDDVLHLLVMTAVLLVTARLMGEVAIRLRQPPVVGEIIAGVVLGPSMLSAWIPWVADLTLPKTETSGYLLELVGLIGAMLLLVVTGIETDLPLIRRNARLAASIATGGLVLPFAGGLAVAWLVPATLLADPSRRGLFSMFLATAVSVSAIPVVAKVLFDLGLIRRRFGQTVLAAGMIDDTVAWILLSVVLALAADTAAGPVGAALAAGKILLFLLLAFTVGRMIVDRGLALVQDRGRSPDRVLTVVMVAAFLLGAGAQALGVEALLGAFVAGILLGRNPRLPAGVVRRLHSFTFGVFAPVFFAIAGLKVRLADLASPEVAPAALAVMTIAVLGKLIGAAVGARTGGTDTWTSLAYGAALNARGAVGIIIASIGLSAGILSPAFYSIVVVTAVATSVITPPLVRALIRRAPGDEDDDRRHLLESEDARGGGAPRRVLVPVRPRPEASDSHLLEGAVIAALAPDASVTLLSVADRQERAMAEHLLGELARAFPGRPTARVVPAADPVKAVLEAAAADHDLIVLGAPERLHSADTVFNPVVDDIVRMAPCPSLIVTGGEGPWPPRRILVPTNGGWAARRATRLAFTLAGGGDAEVLSLHVLLRPAGRRLGAPDDLFERELARADEISDGLRRLADAHGVPLITDVRTAESVADTVLAAVEEHAVDLVILGTNLQPASNRLHLGPQVETVLRRAPCPVMVLNSV